MSTKGFLCSNYRFTNHEKTFQTANACYAPVQVMIVTEKKKKIVTI